MNILINYLLILILVLLLDLCYLSIVQSTMLKVIKNVQNKPLKIKFSE